jgi:uncharacterized protein DUF6538
MARHAYVCRREGRYLFGVRLPTCLVPGSKPAFRISLRTSDQRVAVRRAARIASWMMSVKAADDPKEALRVVAAAAGPGGRAGYARNAIIHHGRLDKGVQLIVKPFSFNELAAKVRDVLDASRE